jgi:replicative DNA helicase
MKLLKTFDIKEPPFNDGLEADILGMLILEPKRLRDFKDKVKVDAFFNEHHIQIYTAMLYLINNNQEVNYYTLMDRLKYKDGDARVDYLLGLANSVASTVNYDNKVDLLNELYYKRVLYGEAQFLLSKELSGITSGNLVKRLQDKLEDMGTISNLEYTKFEDYIDEWLEYQEDETLIQSHKLGFKLLDDLVLLEDSNLMLIGARPSVGKSAFATNLVKNFCLQGKHPLFVSLEMNKREFLNRLVSNMGHIEARKLKRKESKSKEEWQRIMAVKDKIGKFKFNFYDKGGMKVEQLLGLCRFLKQKGELDVLVIDYLQLLESNAYKGQKQNQVSYISQKLKQLAMELDIPVIALSQLSRGVIESDGKPRKPQLSDLRDSGSLEQDANIVLMLHTDDTEQKFEFERFIKLFIRKNRDGKLGEIDYGYKGDYVDFVEKIWNKDTKRFDVVMQDDLENEIVIDEEDLPF